MSGFVFSVCPFGKGKVVWPFLVYAQKVVPFSPVAVASLDISFSFFIFRTEGFPPIGCNIRLLPAKIGSLSFG